MEKVKHIALVAHDNRKKDLIEWVEWNYQNLLKHKLTCTGTTGKLIKKAIDKKLAVDEDSEREYTINILKSGPLGGDQQLGALITDGKVFASISIMYHADIYIKKVTDDEYLLPKNRCVHNNINHVLNPLGFYFDFTEDCKLIPMNTPTMMLHRIQGHL